MKRDLESWNVLSQVWGEEPGGVVEGPEQLPLFLLSVGCEPLWQQQCDISLSLSEKLDMEKQQYSISPSCNMCVSWSCKGGSLVGTKYIQLTKK